jgi:hypothetical protein
MKLGRGLLFLNLFALLSCRQTFQLKSTAHGLKMMLENIPKEQLINEIKFQEGHDDKVNVIRLDHVGPNSYPLLISSKLPIPTDSLGLLSFKLPKDSLSNFLWTIDHVNPKSRTRHFDKILIRVTYRYEGRLEQYYETNEKIASAFLMIIERKLKNYKDSNALTIFYKFAMNTGLLVEIEGKRTWRAFNTR